jgi:uncharacterized protein YraI
MKKQLFWLVSLVLLVTSCTVPPPTATPSAALQQSPNSPETSTPTDTLVQPTLTATPFLVDGTLTIKVNVRSGPGITYDSLGQLDAGGKIQVLAQDDSGGWYQIFYPVSSQDHGWVAAQYITIPTGIKVPSQATSTPAGPSGRLLQRLNVRSGPGTSYNSLGFLEANAQVSLTGKNNTASWFQIDYPTGPGGHGWVTAQYVQTGAAADLPVLDEFGNIVTPGASGTPSGPDLATIPTIGPALADGDSSTNPAINITFSAVGTRRFIYSSQVSTPQGDPEDWLVFTPFSPTGTNAMLVFSLTCTGNGSLIVELSQGGRLLSGWGTLGCGDKGKILLLPAGQLILVHLAAVSGNGLQVVAYRLDVQNNP